MLHVFAAAVQSTQAPPLKPQWVSRSRTSTKQLPSLVQQPEQLAAPHGPQTRVVALHRSEPLQAVQVPEPHASAWVPLWQVPAASQQPPGQLQGEPPLQATRKSRARQKIVLMRAL